LLALFRFLVVWSARAWFAWVWEHFRRSFIGHHDGELSVRRGFVASDDAATADVDADAGHDADGSRR